MDDVDRESNLLLSAESEADFFALEKPVKAVLFSMRPTRACAHGQPPGQHTYMSQTNYHLRTQVHDTQHIIFTCTCASGLRCRRRARSQKDRDAQAVAAAGGRMEQLVRLRGSAPGRA